MAEIRDDIRKIALNITTTSEAINFVVNLNNAEGYNKSLELLTALGNEVTTIDNTQFVNNDERDLIIASHQNNTKPSLVKLVNYYEKLRNNNYIQEQEVTNELEQGRQRVLTQTFNRVA